MFIGLGAIQPSQPLDDDHSSHSNLENLPARFLLHAFRFFRTNRIDTQGMKKNKLTVPVIHRAHRHLPATNQRQIDLARFR
jgi:hypothetical protein